VCVYIFIVHFYTPSNNYYTASTLLCVI